VSSHTGQTGAPHRSNRYPLVRPVRPTGQTVWRCCSTVFGSSVLALWINQGTQWFSGEPLETPRTQCSLRQSPLMTRLPRGPGSTLVMRLNQETVHDFILLFMPPCGPHLTPLATGSLERSLLDFSTWRPHRRRPFALVLHLHQHQSSRNLHLQYLAKKQSTQRCQPLITQGSDHLPVLEPHMVLRASLDDSMSHSVMAAAAAVWVAVARSTVDCLAASRVVRVDASLATAEVATT
jgi:hypothetical protein